MKHKEVASMRERLFPPVKNHVVGFLGFAIVSFFLVGCEQGFELAKRDVSSGQLSDADKRADDDVSSGDLSPGPMEDDLVDQDFSGPGAQACLPGSSKNASANLVTDAISGANIVFLIDDSGSMTNEFQKVVWELQEFIDGILAVTSNNYRIVLIFDKNKMAIRNKTFFRNDGTLIEGSNPFVDQIADPSVFYVERETWSKYADIAFFEAFGNPNQFQSLPSFIPEDQPYSRPPIALEDCDSAGQYFRPRQMVSDYGYGTLGCYNATLGQRISDYLLPNINVNFVTITDDDLNAAWLVEEFDLETPGMDAYPEIVDLMFKDVISELGDEVGYQYHSIVGPEGSQSGPTIDRDGLAHLALSKLTGGATYDIRENNWQPLFSHLQEQIVYSEQAINLDCSPDAVKSVKINGSTISSEHYQVISSQKRVQLLGSAFDGYESGAPLSVEVSYTAQ